MKSWKFSGNSDRNWVSDQGKKSETYSAWYNGMLIKVTHFRRESFQVDRVAK